MLLTVPFWSLPLQPLAKWCSEVDLIKTIGLHDQNTTSTRARVRRSKARRIAGWSGVSMAAWIYLHAAAARRQQVVRATGLHPPDPGCHRASAEVSSSKTRSEHQPPGCCSAPQFDLWPRSVREGVLPFWESSSGQEGGGACYLSSAVIVWTRVASRSLPCTLLTQQIIRLLFKAVQQHVIVSIYRRIRHASAPDVCQIKAAKARNMHVRPHLLTPPSSLSVIPLKLHTFAWKWPSVAVDAVPCFDSLGKKKMKGWVWLGVYFVRSYHWQ